MSIETLEMLSPAEYTAGHAIGLSEVDMAAIAAQQKPIIRNLGDVPYLTRDGSWGTISTVRAESSLSDGERTIKKGGSRLTTNDNIEKEAGTLAVGMGSKTALGILDYRGDPVDGGKTVSRVRGRLTLPEKQSYFYQYGKRMHDLGFGGYDKSVPAGDIGTTDGRILRRYADAFHEASDNYWQASITGKPEEVGGLEFRKKATGYGAYLAAVKLYEDLDLDGTARITISGAGNVGGYTGHYASQDRKNRFCIRGYSDEHGTLIVKNTDSKIGIIVTDEVLEIMDNPSFATDERYAEYAGNKLRAVHDVLLRDAAQSGLDLQLELTADPRDIMHVETDIMVPASVGGVIDEAAALALVKKDEQGKHGVLGIVEAGNDALTKEAVQILAKNRVHVVPGAIANIGGVATSMYEHTANVLAVDGIDATPQTEADTKAKLDTDTQRLFTEVFHMRDILQEQALARGKDPRQISLEFATHALVMVSKARRTNKNIHPDFADIFSYQAYDLAR